MDGKCLALMLFLVAPTLSAPAVADKVYLTATDKDGHPTNMMRPNEVMTLNCAYSVDPLYLNFFNGSDKTIFVVNFITGVNMVGKGFEKIVSNPIIGNGWISIDFKPPYCYEDAVIKCSVIDQMADQHEHKRYFPVGGLTGCPHQTCAGVECWERASRFPISNKFDFCVDFCVDFRAESQCRSQCRTQRKSQHRAWCGQAIILATGKPQITMDGENIKCGSEITGSNNISLDCHAYGVYPEGRFSWSTGCTEHKRISSEDREKCLFNSTSIADCSAADIPESKKLTCTFGNGFGGGDCSLFIKQAAKYRPPGVPSRRVNRRGLKIH